MNTTQSSFLTVFIKEKKIDKIVLRPQSNGTLYPPEKTKKDQMFLKSYNWQAAIRPKDPEDIFTVTSFDKSQVQNGRQKQKGVVTKPPKEKDKK